MNTEFKKRTPQIKSMLIKGQNLEEISKILGLESKGLLSQLRKNLDDFSDLSFIRNK